MSHSVSYSESSSSDSESNSADWEESPSWDSEEIEDEEAPYITHYKGSESVSTTGDSLDDAEVDDFGGEEEMPMVKYQSSGLPEKEPKIAVLQEELVENQAVRQEEEDNE